MSQVKAGRSTHSLPEKDPTVCHGDIYESARSLEAAAENGLSSTGRDDAAGPVQPRQEAGQEVLVAKIATPNAEIDKPQQGSWAEAFDLCQTEKATASKETVLPTSHAWEAGYQEPCVPTVSPFADAIASMTQSDFSSGDHTLGLDLGHRLPTTEPAIICQTGLTCESGLHPLLEVQPWTRESSFGLNHLTQDDNSDHPLLSFNPFAQHNTLDSPRSEQPSSPLKMHSFAPGEFASELDSYFLER